MPEGQLQRTCDTYRIPPEFETAETRRMREHYIAPAMAALVDREAREFGYDTGWRAPHENAAEQLKRRGMTANVIEGEQY